MRRLRLGAWHTGGGGRPAPALLPARSGRPIRRGGAIEAESRLARVSPCQPFSSWGEEAWSCTERVVEGRGWFPCCCLTCPAPVRHMRTRKSKSRRSVLGSRERGGRLLLHSQGAILGPQIAFQRLKHDRKLLRPPSLKSQLRKSMHSETSADHQLETIIGKFAELDWRMIDATCACFLDRKSVV